MTVVGVDLSSFMVHTAWIGEDGYPRRWFVEMSKRGRPATPTIDRIRNVRMMWPLSVTEVAIEMPFGPNTRTTGVLMAVVGAVTRSVPRQARVAWPSSAELRNAIGARNNKRAAHRRLARLDPPIDRIVLGTWDEHELDALVACLGWTAILNAQENA